MDTNEFAVKRILLKAQELGVSKGPCVLLGEMILVELQAAYKRGADSIRQSPDYHYREDMGR